MLKLSGDALSEHMRNLRRIVSEKRAAASRLNGKLGGRPLEKRAKRKIAA